MHPPYPHVLSLAAFITEPVPNKAAAAAIRDKPAVTRAVFDELPPELKSLAFTITGIEDVKTIQFVRDQIADLPLGGDYDHIKEAVARKLEERFTPAAALIRAELLLRLHGGQAYAAAQYRVMDRQRDVFPYWQYLTFGDDRVRASHAALNRKIFRHDSPFWKLHYPPWAYLCRCKVTPLTQRAVDRIQEQDAKLHPIKRRLLEGPLLDKALNEHILFSPANDGTTHDITPPSVSDPKNGYRWHPGTLGVPVDKLKKNIDPDLWNVFQKKAEGIKLGRGTLWTGMQKLGKDAGAAIGPPKEAITPAKRAAILKALGMTEEDYAKHLAAKSGTPTPPTPSIPTTPDKPKPAQLTTPAQPKTAQAAAASTATPDRPQTAKEALAKVTALSKKFGEDRALLADALPGLRQTYLQNLDLFNRTKKGLTPEEYKAAVIQLNTLAEDYNKALLRLKSLQKEHDSHYPAALALPLSLRANIKAESDDEKLVDLAAQSSQLSAIVSPTHTPPP